MSGVLSGAGPTSKPSLIAEPVGPVLNIGDLGGDHTRVRAAVWDRAPAFGDAVLQELDGERLHTLGEVRLVPDAVIVAKPLATSACAKATARHRRWQGRRRNRRRTSASRTAPSSRYPWSSSLSPTPRAASMSSFSRVAEPS